MEQTTGYGVADAARDALQVQDACNLSGVARGFVRAIDALRAGGVTDTDAVRRHPVAVLFAHKLASLAGVEPMSEGDTSRYFRASRECEELAGVTP
jgi:hypothetical protein